MSVSVPRADMLSARGAGRIYEYTPQFGLSEAIGPPTRSPCDCRSGELITPF
jgi:hypothetical protein